MPVESSQTGRLVIAGIRGSSGKSVLSLGLARQLHNSGLDVVPFKKGPDYIDSGWLTLAARRRCRTLDTYLAAKNYVLNSFIDVSRCGDLALIEGNRGLHDGLDEAGTYSTGELAKFLEAPVVLIVDCSKTTRTAAAMVAGCRVLDPDVKIAAVVLNRVANRRHSDTVSRCIERETGLPVMGALPKLSDFPFPERHLGLVMPLEHEAAEEAVEAAAELVANHVDIEALNKLAQDVPELECEAVSRVPSVQYKEPVRIGVIKDPAFSFYYPENLDSLKRAGARIVEINSLADTELPDIHALYIGGGFPETMAEKLAANYRFRREVKKAAEGGLPIYAECGGVMYLGESIEYRGRTYPMTGALPITYEFCKKPQGHGYTELEVTCPNPFFEVGKSLRGHEFHYSRVLTWKRDSMELALKNLRGRGFDGEFDGVCIGNILGLYSHMHDVYGCNGWASGIVAAGRAFKNSASKHAHPITIRYEKTAANRKFNISAEDSVDIGPMT